MMHLGALVLLFSLPLQAAYAYALLGTKWDPGLNAASSFLIAPGTPGSASWSVMPMNLGLDAAILANLNQASPLYDQDHMNPATNTNVPTTSLDAFLGIPTSASEEVAIINNALNLWDAASGFTNFGMVADGGAAGGALMALNGHIGDIRIGAFQFFTTFGVLGGTFRPSTETLSLGLPMEGQGGTIGGDIHMNNAVFWADDATDLFSDPDVDFFSIMLHELGHALGLGHSSVTSAVMFPSYSGAKRVLSSDDIAGIRAIYGPNTPVNSVPEPTTTILLALGLLGAGLARRLRIL